MPALPDIVLGEGEVLLSTAASLQGLISKDGKTGFATVVMVYSGSDRTTVGTGVMFEPSKTRQLIFGSTIYLLIKENDLSGKENPIP